MKIVIGSDHAGFEAKRRLIKALQSLGHSVVDVGTEGTESVDYPDFASQVAMQVADGDAQRGVLVCGTGIGMSMAANKVKGVRAAVVTDEFTAEMSRKHNDANVLCMGARVLAPERMETLARIFLATSFEGGRHQGRVDKIRKLEGG